MGKAVVVLGMAIGVAVLGARAKAQGSSETVPPSAAGAPVSGVARLTPLHGIWRGSAMVNAGGRTLDLVHTERVGPLLGGTIALIEGKSYNKDGSEAGFNALAVVSCQAGETACEMRSYAQGRAGTFPFTIRADGFDWSLPAGPDGIVSYHAVVGDGRWHEEGWFERGGQRLAKVYEADLKRVGPTDWPAAGTVTAG